MKKIYVVGNWKSNKTIEEAEEWIKQVSSIKYQVLSNLEIILCSPFTLLHFLHLSLITYHLSLKLGAQDISPFPDGAYTGEVSGRMLADLGVEYVIIGHSERRKYFGETDQVLEDKVKEALDFKLTPIFCVQDENTPLPHSVKLVAYEPVFAIGTGKPDTAQNANLVVEEIKKKNKNVESVLYGGSVTAENISSFIRQPNINGVLVGSASQDFLKFWEILKNVSKTSSSTL